MKNVKMLEDAVNYGVETITIESLSHLNDLLSVLPEEKKQKVKWEKKALIHIHMD